MNTEQHLPEPLTPPEADLQDFPYTPIYRAWLFGSSFHAKANDAEWRAGLTLWLKAQDQKPAGSLPDDDLELCRLAELGRDTKTWKKLRPRALHGWFVCSDGRLYHEVVAKVVNDQWREKTEQRSRTLKARIAALEKRLSEAKSQNVKDDISAQLQKLRQEPVTDAPQKPVTETKGRKGKEREGNKERENTTPPSSSPTARVIRGADGDVMDRAGKLQAKLERDLSLGTPVTLAPIVSWMQAGASAELIEATIADVMAKRPGWKPDGIGYFGKAILRAIEAGKADGHSTAQTAGEVSDLEAKRIAMKAKAEQIAKGQYMPTVEIDDVRGMIHMGWITAEQATAVGYRL